MLIREGWEVEILERTRKVWRGVEPGSCRSGLCSRRWARRRRGKPNIGIRVTKRVAYDRAGNAFATHRYDQYSTSWSLLYNLLRDAFPMQHFHARTNVPRSCKTAIAPWPIAGRRNDIRRRSADRRRRHAVQQFAGAISEVQPQYVGYLAWRGMLEERYATPSSSKAASPRSISDFRKARN